MNTPSTCSHFSHCSGCQRDRDFFNPPAKEEMVQFFQKHGAPLVFYSDGFAKTRWRAKLAIRGGPENPKIGLFKRNTHEALPIPDCMVHHPLINEGCERLRRAISKHHLAPYSENPPTGQLRYAQFTIERSTGLVQLALSLTEMNSEAQALCNDLGNWWHSIWINVNPHNTNRIFGPTWIHHSGAPWLWQQFGLTSVAYHPGAFSQVHLPLFETLLQTIERWIPENATCLELFAGTGAISLFIRHKCKHIDLIENNPLSALSFETSLTKLVPPHHLTYHTRDATGPLDTYDVIIADPSRKGLGAPLLYALKQNQSSRFIYVSCDFGSFQRDARALIAAGWQLKEGAGFFFFPGTNEIETAALFEQELPLKNF